MRVPEDVLLLARERRASHDSIGPDSSGRAAVGSVAGAAFVAVLLRLPLVNLPAFPDEGGYLLVARHWHSGGPELYGHFFVDRPPLLIAFWRLADALGGIEAGRWLALIAVASLIVSAGSAGWSISGLQGARWAAITAAFFSVSPLLAAPEVDGELLAAPLVMMSCALTLLACRQRARVPTAAYAVLAGVTAASAVLVKQNFIEGFVFIAVVLFLSSLRGHINWRAAGRVLTWAAAGSMVPATVTVWWAVTQPAGLGGLYYTLFGFRSAASAVIGAHSLSAPKHRFAELMGLMVLSGLLPLVAYFVGRASSTLRRPDPVVAAITCMMLLEAAGIALGGSYWSHYLLGMIPAVSLGVAWLVGRPGTAPRILVAAAATANLVSLLQYTASPHTGGAEAAVVTYLRQAHTVGDTGYVAYGHPNILESSGLRPTYTHLWSLPLRVLDPHLTRLTQQMRGPHAPTWFVEGSVLDSWNIDDEGQLQEARDENYRWVATVCGVTIYLHNGLSRPNAPVSVPC